jgi:aerobic carbon-monoxide dehydrogenase large subunit
MPDSPSASAALVQPDADPRSRRRSEDARFLTGQGAYVGDLAVPGELHAVLVRSPHAHASIRAVDVTGALAVPGVRAVYTAADLLAEGIGPLPCSLKLPEADGLVVPPRLALAQGTVRHVGDPVACVVADTPQAALDGAEQVLVDYEPLQAIVDPRQALAPDAPAIWPIAPGNRAFRFRRGDAEAVAAAMAEAAHVVGLDLVNPRVAAAAMETRTAVGSYDRASGIYRLVFSGASVHLVRNELADSIFRVPRDRVEVACPDVGGGFGAKNVTYPEYVLVLFAARRLGAPVRWTAERTEDLVGGVHGRDNLTRARLALDAQGRFLALSVETTANVGAYLSSLGPGPATTAPMPAMGGVYAIPSISMDVTGVFTHTAPIDAYRGAGKPEANYVIERLVEAAARRLGKDPAALRRLNLIRSFPYRTAMGATLDGGDLRAMLDHALARADAKGFGSRRRRVARTGRLLGQGVGFFLETSRGQPGEEASLVLDAQGKLLLTVGTQSNGQGHETSFVQALAERLRVPFESIRYTQADTARIATGGGHGGARSLHMGGTAMLLAADDLLRQARAVAARLLQSDEATMTFANGAFSVPGSANEAERSIELLVLKAAAEAAGLEAPLAGHGRHDGDRYTFPMGCHVVELEVDPETGETSIRRYVAVDDFGTLLNPLLTAGQIHGGLAQGIGQALMEEIGYDASSGQMTAATFMDYAMPRAADIPALDVSFVEVPTTANPLGAKGAGQAGAIAAPPVVVNALLDALRPLGVGHLDMPATPSRIWQAIQAARASDASG